MAVTRFRCLALLPNKVKTQLLLLSLLTCLHGFVHGTVTYSREQDSVIVVAGERAMVTMDISGVETNLRIQIESQDPGSFVVYGNDTFDIIPVFEDGSMEPDVKANHIIMFTLEGVFIGIGKLDFEVVNIEDNIDLPENTIPPLTVKVRRPPAVITDVFTYTITVFLFLSYVSMGVKMNWGAVWKRLRRPWGVLIGAISQFIVMPLVAYVLAKIANLDDVSAVGLIIVACCPGGYTSNVITLLVECDLVLSITMTAVSTFLAFGLMPLNVFLYAREFTRENESLKTPFTNLILSLLLLLIPIFVGIFCHYKLPKVAKYLKMIMQPFGIILVVLTIGFGIPVFLYAFQAPPVVYLVSITMPLISATFGTFLSKICCLDNRSAITVAIETGYQNALVGVALAQLSYPQPEADLISRGPCLYFLFSLIEGSAIVGLCRLMKRFPGKPVVDDESQREEDAPLDNTAEGATDPVKVDEAEGILSSPTKVDEAERNSKV